jgi:steroid 5-alpha reductase family enzyme
VTPFILLTAWAIIIIIDVMGWLCYSLLSWYDLLLTYCLHVSPLLMALHVVKVEGDVRVEGICGQ